MNEENEVDRDLRSFMDLVKSNSKREVELKLLSVCESTLMEINEEGYLNKKDYPSTIPMVEMLDTYEGGLELFMGMLYSLTNLESKTFSDSIIDCYERLLYAPVNKEDGYGYIWRQLNNYPTLLCLYGIGIASISTKNFDLLNAMFMRPTKDSYYDGSFVQTMKVYAIEKINCYHPFNFIEGLSVHWSDYFPDSEKYKSRSQNLYINNRVFDFYEYINRFVKIPFYSEQFDIFEYLVGLVFMDLRLQKDNSIKFAPFGRNYIKTIINNKWRNSIENFLDRNESNMLSANLFGGDSNRYKSAREEYRIFLKEVAKNF